MYDKPSHATKTWRGHVQCSCQLTRVWQRHRTKSGVSCVGAAKPELIDIGTVHNFAWRNPLTASSSCRLRVLMRACSWLICSLASAARRRSSSVCCFCSASRRASLRFSAARSRARRCSASSSASSSRTCRYVSKTSIYIATHSSYNTLSHNTLFTR